MTVRLVAALTFVRKMTSASLVQARSHCQKSGHSRLCYRRVMETDELTGLPTRRELASRHGATKRGTLVLLDIDHLSVVRGTLGHELGDRVVAEVGRLVADACSAAYVARMSGGEFAALFLDEREDVAVQAAEAVRATAEGRFAEVREQCRRAGVDSSACARPLTVSLCVVSVGWYGSLERALPMADRALRHAKLSGGNRVALALPGRPGIDALTGLLNRHAFEASFENARSSAREGFGVIYADLNSFKRINDVRGYEFGDEVLVAVARALWAQRGLESAARFGGDEFTAILPISAFELDRAAADLWQSLVESGAQFREQLSDVIAEVRPTYLGPPRPPLGISVVAIWMPPDASYSHSDVQQVADDMFHAIASLKGTGHMVLRLPR